MPEYRVYVGVRCDYVVLVTADNPAEAQKKVRTEMGVADIERKGELKDVAVNTYHAHKVEADHA